MNARPWKTVGATTPGLRHLREGVGCQDYCQVTHLSDDEDTTTPLVIAVADGAGSAREAACGAKYACRAAIRHIQSQVYELHDPGAAERAVTSGFRAARRELEARAAGLDADLPDLATTLLITVVHDEFAVFAQVGDGLAIYGLGDELEVAHWPDQEVLNLTDFITSRNFEDALHARTVKGTIDRVACMTDGVTPLLVDQRLRAAHPPVMQRMFEACRSHGRVSDQHAGLERFLASEAANERSDDDKTLVLAVR